MSCRITVVHDPWLLQDAQGSGPTSAGLGCSRRVREWPGWGAGLLHPILLNSKSGCLTISIGLLLLDWRAAAQCNVRSELQKGQGQHQVHAQTACTCQGDGHNMMLVRLWACLRGAAAPSCTKPGRGLKTCSTAMQFTRRCCQVKGP